MGADSVGSGRGIRRALLTLPVVVTWAGCEAITGVDGLQEVPSCPACDGSTDGPDAPPEAPPPSDGPKPDATMPDATMRDVALDQQPPLDVSPEAPVDAGVRWCASQTTTPTFCDDFDVGPLGATWDNQSVSPLTSSLTLAMVPTPIPSPPNTLFSSTPAVMSGGYAQATLSKSLSKNLGTARYQFAVYVATVDPTVPYPKLAALAVNSLRWGLFVQLLSGRTAELVEAVPTADGGVMYPGYTLTQSIPKGTWTTVEIDTTAGLLGGVATFSVKINGTVALQPTSVAIPVSGTPSIDIGVFGVDGPSTGWTAYFDNVAVYL